MAMSVVTNVAALGAARTLAATDQQVTTSLRRLSTGLRIGAAADDAAGLSISEGLRAQIGGMSQAVRNVQDGINLVRVAEGALAETHAILHRWRDLKLQQMNTGALDAEASAAIDTEMSGLGRELNRIAEVTTYNGIPLLDGSFDRVIQVGASAGDTLRITIPPDGNALDFAGMLLSTGSTDGVLDLHAAITWVSTVRGHLGATENRLNHTLAGLGTTVENLTAAESRIRDADMAQESVALARHQVLTQAGTAMLGQAQQSARSVLSLLG